MVMIGVVTVRAQSSVPTIFEVPNAASYNTEPNTYHLENCSLVKAFNLTPVDIDAANTRKMFACRTCKPLDNPGLAKLIKALPAAPLTAKPPANRPVSLTFSRALIKLIQDHAVAAGSSFLGVSQHGDRSLKLYVTSGRSLIAFKTSQAADSGGRYTATADIRDVVIVDCGDNDLGEIFECSRVKVTTPDGRTIAPLSYTAGPHAYRNALGARWSVREVHATYPIGLLRDGFDVTYADFDSTEWVLRVTPKDAAEQLLLRIDQGPTK